MLREKEYKVVVTACAPFKDEETNPTQDVKLGLPDRIEREGRIPIKIIKFHIDFRNVLTDMDIIPTLWNGDKRVYEPDCDEGKRIFIDAILHLGMNFEQFWEVEERARRDGYDWVGDDGLPLPRHNGGKGGRWEGMPEELGPVFNVGDAVRRAQQEVPDTETRSSTDAGLRYCEFIFYTSLVTLYRRGEMARSLFLHHPGRKTTREDIKDGAKVAASVICSMIDQLEAM